VSASIAVEDLYQALDDRTIEILERRGGGKVRRRGWLVRRALLTADIIGLTVAFIVAQQIYRAQMASPNALSDLSELLLFGASLPGWVIAAKLYGLYERDEEMADHSTADDLVRVFHLVTVCSWGLLALFYLTRLAHPQLPKLLTFWVLAIALITSGRAVARTVCHRHIAYLQNTIIVGAGDTGQALARKLLNHPEYGLNLVGFIDSNPKERGQELRHLTILGDLDELPRIVELLDVERVIVAFTNDGHEALAASISDLRERDVQIGIVPRLFDNLGPSISIHAVEGIPLISLPPTKLPRSSMIIKRTLDAFIAAVIMTMLSPLLLLVAVAVKLDSRGPVFYRHERVGRGGKLFRLLKFRTMYAEACRGADYGGVAAEEEFARLMSDPARRAEFDTAFKLRDDPRVTRLGRLLRRSSIDELPQLWNVLRGDISLVGPRALTVEELDLYYGPAAPVLLGIRPGVTGYWQINGRSQLDYADRVRLDMAYIGGWSLGLDIWILARTARVLLSGRGAA
jgi:exopolysaccharide biosynthesis polyprenyl glycosylphosphotransferase